MVAQPESSRKTRILVVDDERHIVRLLEFVLEREGYDVATAFDGEHALSAVEEFEPDAVFLDLFLPGISGLDVLSRIRSRGSDTSVIVLTSRSFEDTPVDVIAAGAKAHCTKPIAPSTVLRTLARCGLTARGRHAVVATSTRQEEFACAP